MASRLSAVSVGSSVEQPRLTGHGQGRIEFTKFQTAHRPAQAFADHLRRIGAGVRQNDHEFFSAIAEHAVDIAQLCFQAVRDRFQYFITCVMPVVVVHSLEVIDTLNWRLSKGCAL